MHRVVNYGSALQAYALQRFLSAQGYDNEIIDYRFAPKPAGAKNRLRYLLRRGFIKHRKFRCFWEDNYALSARTYWNKGELSEDTCRYDIYMTGSDQVWNPDHGGGELTFMFDFVKSTGARKVSYAASFSASRIPVDKAAVYAECLSAYSSLSVREENALPIVERLAGKECSWVCDPTMLLAADEWHALGDRSGIDVGKPYVLFYILTYAYDPFPQINAVIDKVQKHFKGRKCVFLDGRIRDGGRADSVVAGNLSPYDFLKLVENAGFVVTTSFHGTAFAINFRKPFYSVVHPDTGRDDRMVSLLRRVGLGHRAIRYDKDFVFEPMSYGREVEEHIAGFIEESKAFISGALS